MADEMRLGTGYGGGGKERFGNEVIVGCMGAL